MRLYPLSLIIKGKTSLVVGGGKIAERKVQGLLQAESLVTVISPDVTEQLEQWHAQGMITYHQRLYQQGDLKACSLVIAATNNNKVNKAIYKEATTKTLLINCVDDISCCNFYLPAVVNRGPLQIAVSSSGSLPVLSKKVKQKLDEIIPDDITEEIIGLANLRQSIIKESMGNDSLKNKRVHEELIPQINQMLQRFF